MIRFALKCSHGHGFESWFASGAAYESLRAGGHLACPVCGDPAVEKALMTPALQPERAAPESAPSDAPATPSQALPEAATAGAMMSSGDRALEEKLASLRRHVEENAEYVGKDFADQARRMHLGDAPERSIYGEARIEEARALLEEGVPVAPLPFLPARKVN